MQSFTMKHSAQRLTTSSKPNLQQKAHSPVASVDGARAAASSGKRIVRFAGSNGTVGVAAPELSPPPPLSSRCSRMTVPPIRQTGRTEFARECAGLRPSWELRRDDEAVPVVKVGRRRPMLLTRLPMWKGARLPVAGSSVTLREMVRGR